MILQHRNNNREKRREARKKEVKFNFPPNSSGLNCLNAGCGNRYLNDWVNLDLRVSKHVRYCDLRKGIPYPDQIFDVAYSSNIIEHLFYKQGIKFVGELFRVLKPGGTIRLLTPDLERMAKEYLFNLNEYDKFPTDKTRRKYEWILLELFDQMTREKSGGLMLEKIQTGDICPEYVISRTGDELRPLLTAEKRIDPEPGKDHLHNSFFFQVLRKIVNTLSVVPRGSRSSGKNIPFRESGELHKWYYDRVSLKQLLGIAGFVDFKVVDYRNSRIPGWERMNLDISNSDKSPRKPDSIIVEASKP